MTTNALSYWKSKVEQSNFRKPPRFIKISTNDRHADLRLTDPQNTYHLPKTLRSKQVKKPQSSPP